MTWSPILGKVGRLTMNYQPIRENTPETYHFARFTAKIISSPTNDNTLITITCVRRSYKMLVKVWIDNINKRGTHCTPLYKNYRPDRSYWRLITYYGPRTMSLTSSSIQLLILRNLRLIYFSVILKLMYNIIHFTININIIFNLLTHFLTKCYIFEKNIITLTWQIAES